MRGRILGFGGADGRWSERGFGGIVERLVPGEEDSEWNHKRWERRGGVSYVRCI